MEKDCGFWNGEKYIVQKLGTVHMGKGLQGVGKLVGILEMKWVTSGV